MAQQFFDNTKTGLEVKTVIDANFTELYKSSLVNLLDANKSIDFTQVLPAGTMFDSIDILKISGNPVIRVGTTLNGIEIVDEIEITGCQIYESKQYFATSTTLFVTITGGVISTSINYFKNRFTT